jgi:hypothetical protein
VTPKRPTPNSRRSPLGRSPSSGCTSPKMASPHRASALGMPPVPATSSGAVPPCRPPPGPSQRAAAVGVRGSMPCLHGKGVPRVSLSRSQISRSVPPGGKGVAKASNVVRLHSGIFPIHVPGDTPRTAGYAYEVDFSSDSSRCKENDDAEKCAEPAPQSECVAQ